MVTKINGEPVERVTTFMDLAEGMPIYVLICGFCRSIYHRGILLSRVPAMYLNQHGDYAYGLVFPLVPDACRPLCISKGSIRSGSIYRVVDEQLALESRSRVAAMAAAAPFRVQTRPEHDRKLIVATQPRRRA